MSIKQLFLSVAGIALVSATLTVSAQPGKIQHSMPLAGDGPQEYMMDGASHPGEKAKNQVNNNHSSHQKNSKHYMMHDGDGPQGHNMAGKKHDPAKSTEHRDKYK